MTDHELALKAVRLRRRTLEIICHAGAGHTGGGERAGDHGQDVRLTRKIGARGPRLRRRCIRRGL